MYPIFKSLRNNHTTSATFLRSRIERFSDNELPISTFNLIGGHVEEGAPRSVGDMFSKKTIIEHTINVKVLNGNNTVVIGYEYTGFVEEIFPLVGDPFILDRQSTDSLPPVFATFDLIGNSSMQPLQSLFGFLDMFWILDYSAIGQSGEVFESDIDTYNFIIDGFSVTIGFDFTGEYNEPFTAFDSFDSHGLKFTFRYSVKDDRQITDFRNEQFLIRYEFEPGLRIGNTFEPFLISGKSDFNSLTCFFLFDSPKEIRERFGESIGEILKNLGMDTFEFGIDIFNLSNSFVHIEFIERSAISKIGIFTNSEKHIVHFFRKPKLSIQSGDLLSRRVHSIFIITQTHFNQNYIDLPVYMYLVGSSPKVLLLSDAFLYPPAFAGGLRNER